MKESKARESQCVRLVHLHTWRSHREGADIYLSQKIKHSYASVLDIFISYVNQERSQDRTPTRGQVLRKQYNLS